MPAAKRVATATARESLVRIRVLLGKK